jgi:hypothetical protein
MSLDANMGFVPKYTVPKKCTHPSDVNNIKAETE